MEMIIRDSSGMAVGGREHQAKSNIGIRLLCLPTSATRKHFYATWDLPAKAGIYCQVHREQMNIQG